MYYFLKPSLLGAVNRNAYLWNFHISVYPALVSDLNTTERLRIKPTNVTHNVAFG